MKIYLLMLLIGALLTAIHFTAPSDQPAQKPFSNRLIFKSRKTDLIPAEAAKFPHL